MIMQCGDIFPVDARTTGYGQYPKVITEISQ